MNINPSITSDHSREETEATVRLIKWELGQSTKLDKTGRTKYSTPDARLMLYVIYSKYHAQKDWYFYGLREEDVEYTHYLGEAFVVFILGRHNQLAVIPMRELRSAIHRVGRPYRSDDNYKFNIQATSLAFLNLPLSAKAYLNLFDPLRACIRHT